MARGLMAALSTGALALMAGVAASSGAHAATPSSSMCSTAALVGIDSVDYDLKRWVDLTPNLNDGFDSKSTVGNAWGGMKLLASDSATGTLYGISKIGELRKYTYSGASYTGGQVLQSGAGWERATNLIPMGAGGLYATFPNGEMRSYTISGTTVTAHGVIGQGWNSISSVTSGGAGILYGIDGDSGDLKWFRARGANGTGGFDSAVIGNGWNIYTRIIGAGDGILYATTPSGDLYWYNHIGSQTGATQWASNGRTNIGKGWNTITALTANPNACTPGGVASAPSPNPYPGVIGSNGGYTQRADYVKDQVESRFLGIDCGTYQTGGGDHATGNALDCAAGTYGRTPSASERSEMQALANWGVQHAAALKVQYVIWERHIWNISRASEGWRLMEDRGGVTQNHFDHVHISVQNPGNSSARTTEAPWVHSDAERR